MLCVPLCRSNMSFSLYFSYIFTFICTAEFWKENKGTASERTLRSTRRDQLRYKIQILQIDGRSWLGQLFNSIFHNYTNKTFIVGQWTFQPTRLSLQHLLRTPHSLFDTKQHMYICITYDIIIHSANWIKNVIKFLTL